MILTFPWPPRELSPNARVHWAKKARAAKKYKNNCGWICKAAKLPRIAPGPVHLAIVAYPPDNRHRDADNIMASLKNCQDAISWGFGINDRYFTSNFDWGRVMKGGVIQIEITWGAIKPARIAA